MRSSTLLLLSTGSMVLASDVPARPLITPAPSIENIDLRRRQTSSRMDLASLAQVLLTAVPPSILDLALTNVPAVSRLLWSDFLDDHTPSWFAALPTDVQAYLSGEFGPTTTSSKSVSKTPSTSRSSTTSSTSSASSSAASPASNQVDDRRDSHGGGLPLWAKVVIGVLVPLFVIGLLACILLLCLRRRRRHRRTARAQSRTPTPAFISSSHRPVSPNGRGDQHVPLRGGYLSFGSSSRHNSGSEYHPTSSSEDFHTPIGGPSYDNIPPVTGVQTPRRSSRQSLSSLHSVPEVPEPMHRGNWSSAPIPLPPRSPRRSRDFGQDGGFGATLTDKSARRVSPLNPLHNSNVGDRSMKSNPYYSQGIYAGGHNPYHDPYHVSGNPFLDQRSPYEAGPRNDYDSSGELPLYEHGGGYPVGKREYESNWPLQALHDSGYQTSGRNRPHEEYEKVYEM